MLYAFCDEFLAISDQRELRQKHHSSFGPISRDDIHNSRPTSEPAKMTPVPVVNQTKSVNGLRKSNVWAVVVTHNPTSDFEQNVRDLAPQVDELVIVDNQSSPVIRQFIEKVASAHNTKAIWGQQNLGIASALNAGIDLALASSECRWILMLDQDSHVPPDFVATMFDAYEACAFKDEVALIGANYQLVFRTLQPPSPAGNTPAKEVKTLMTSGTLAKRTVFTDCGSFDESFFMDYVDHEFCFRVRRHGLRIIQAKNAILQHRLGSPTLHRMFGRPFITANYSAIRRYHQARNRLIFYRRYLYTDTKWIVCDCFRWFREILKVMVVEPDRRNKLASIARGVWDGLVQIGQAAKAPTRGSKSLHKTD
jgi:rhamnosyltransferase